MIPVIILAHGSRHQQAATDLHALRRSVAARSGRRVELAFLDLCRPSIDQVCAQLHAEGEHRAVVVPLLFTSAYHHKVDVVDALKNQPIALECTDLIGTGEDVAQLFSAPQNCTHLLYAVGSTNPEANQAVRELAARVGAQAVFATGVDKHELAHVVQDHESVHISPLFFANGVLLDHARAALTQHTHVSFAPPLAHRAASVVLARL